MTCVWPSKFIWAPTQGTPLACQPCPQPTHAWLFLPLCRSLQGSAGAALHWSGEVAAIPIQPFGTGPDANGLPAASGMERLRRSPFATERLQQGTAAALDHAAAVSRGSGPRANVHTEVVGGGPLYGIVDNARRPAPAAPAPLRTTPHVSLRPITCLMSTWKPWTQCSKSCAGGVQSRGRVILRRPSGGGDVCPALAESRSCNEQPCHKEGHRKSKARPTPRPLQRDVAVEQFTPETFENGPLTPEVVLQSTSTFSQLENRQKVVSDDDPEFGIGILLPKQKDSAWQCSLAWMWGTNPAPNFILQRLLACNHDN